MIGSLKQDHRDHKSVSKKQDEKAEHEQQTGW